MFPGAGVPREGQVAAATLGESVWRAPHRTSVLGFLRRLAVLSTESGTGDLGHFRFEPLSERLIEKYWHKNRFRT